MSEMKWIEIKTLDDLPKKPGKQDYETIPCVLIYDGEFRLSHWNCEHGCWDDSEGDDFFCKPLEPKFYAVLTWPDVQQKDGA